jgi:hypothetical protein
MPSPGNGEADAPQRFAPATLRTSLHFPVQSFERIALTPTHLTDCRPLLLPCSKSALEWRATFATLTLETSSSWRESASGPPRPSESGSRFFDFASFLLLFIYVFSFLIRLKLYELYSGHHRQRALGRILLSIR